MAVFVDQQQTQFDNNCPLGSLGTNQNYNVGQSFKLSASLTVVAIEVYYKSKTPSPAPTGNWTFRIETNNAGYPSGTLANAKAQVVVTPPVSAGVSKGTFADIFVLSGSTTYWIVVLCDNQANNASWRLGYSVDANPYPDGVRKQQFNGVWQDTTNDLYFKVYADEPIFSFDALLLGGD